MKTFDGYKKQALTDVYALLAGGGHKPLSDFSMAHTHPYLPLSGGTMTGEITLTSGSNNAYDKTALSFIKSSNKTEQARIGTNGNNGLGLYATGNIYIRPNVTLGRGSTNGLVISNSSFTYNGTTVSLNGHTHTTSIATSTDTNQITLAYGGKYKLTTGGTSYVFTMPTSDNTWRPIGTGATDAAAGNHIHKNLIIKWGTGDTEGTNLFTYNGGTTKTINLSTPFSLLFTNFSNAGSLTTSISIGGITKTLKIDADTVDGYHADSFYRYRGSYGKSYTDESTEYSLSTGTYVTSEKGHSGTLLSFSSSSSASALQFWTHYNQGNLYYRTSVDNNKWSKTNGAWTRILDSDNYNIYTVKKDGTGASGTWGINITGNASTATALTTSAGSATLPIYFSGGKPIACTASLVFSNLSNSGNNISVTVAGLNRTLTVGYATNTDKVDGYHANKIYNAPSFTVYNNNTSNTYILLATITINGTSLNCAEFTTLFQNRECLDSSSFILSGAIRRVSTTNVSATLSYITLHTKTPRNIYLRSDDGVTFRVYILSATDKWTTYYRAIPIVDSENITYSNTGTSSPISGSVLNITATKGGNTNYADSAGNADTLDNYHANGLLTALSNSDNGISITVGGTTKSISNISVNYANSAGNADTVDGYHASSFYTNKPLRSDKNSIYDLRNNYGTYDKGDYNGTYKDEYPTNYGAYLSLAYNNKNIGALMFFDAPTSNALGHIHVRTRGAGDSNTTYSGWGTLAYLTDNVASANYASSAGNADTTDGLHLYTRNLGINGTSWTFASTANANATTHIYAATSAGTNGQILKSTGGTPTWINQSDLSVGSAGYANKIASKGMLDSQEKIDNFITANRFEYAIFKTTDSNNVGFAYNDGMILSIPWSNVKYGAQMAFDDTTFATVKVRAKSSSWGNWYTLLHSGNYNDYAPSKTGTGASGTWGINITGSAGSVAWGNITGKPSSFAPASHNHSFTLGATTITTGRIYSKITGPFVVYTDASAEKAFSIYRSNAAEGVKHWVDDSMYHIEYTNDEATSIIAIRLINTDSERSTNKGADAKDVTVYLDCYRNFYPSDNNTGSIGTSSNKWANMYATTFHGSLDGNATSASKWLAARTLTLTGSVTGSVSIDGSSNVTLATTTNHTHTWANIENKPSTFTPSSHTHTISNITNLQATLDGKAAASHTHNYLSLSGGTMTGLIVGNNKGGYWIAGRSNSAIYQSRNTTGDWHPVVGFKTKTGSWEFGSVGEDDIATFSWGSDSNYNSRNNVTTRVNLRAISGTIALTSEIPTKASWNYDDIYSKLGHTHDDRYYTESEINTKLAGKAESSHTHTALMSERFDTNAPAPNSKYGLTFQFSYNLSTDASGWWNVLNMRSYTDSNYTSAQIITPANNPGKDTDYSGNMKWRQGRNSTWLDWKTIIDSSNYTNYVNTTNFPGLNKVGTVTSVTVTGANGLSGTGTITTSGTITLSNTGVRSTTINGNYLRINTNGTNTDLTIPYATTASLLNNTSVSDPNTAASGLNVKWYSQINQSSGYAGTNYGFPVSNNANGILWLGTYSGTYGWLLGFSSNNRIYARYISNNTFPKTANGGSWNRIAWTTDIPTSLKNPNTLTLQAGTFAAKTYDGSAAVTVNIPTHTSHLVNNSGFLTLHLSLDNYVTTTLLSLYLPLAGGTLTGSIILKGGTSADMTYASNIHPCIRFDNSDSSLNISLIFTEFDTYRAPAGIKLVGNQGNEWFEATNIYATTFYGALSGTASTATKLTSSAGSTSLPVYFSDGKPVACNKASIFSNLSNNGNNISITVAGLTRTLTVGYASEADWASEAYSAEEADLAASAEYADEAGDADTLDGYHASSFSTTSHTHTLTLASDTGANPVALVHGGKYKLTAGGSSIIFTLPADNNTAHTEFSWTNGSTEGPTGSLSGNHTTVSFSAIPSATASISGIVTTGTLSFAGNKTFNGHITLGNNYQLKRDGYLASWYNGRDRAIVRQTSANNYTAIISSKTANGSWEMGNYTSNGDSLYFTYITDSNYNSKNNIFSAQVYFNSSGSIYATHFYENSDIRYKKILRNLSINSNTIANLPLFDFEWIENNAIGTGTSALAVQQILPNLVSGTNKLTLDYGVLGTIAGITACKELVKVNIEIFTLKSELLQLKEKVKLLEDKLRKYENI